MAVTSLKMIDAIDRQIPTMSDLAMRQKELLGEGLLKAYLKASSYRTKSGLSVVDFDKLKKPGEKIADLLGFFVDNSERRKHCLMIGNCAKKIGEWLEVENTELLFNAGTLHDVGNYPDGGKKAPWHIWKGVIILESLGFKQEAEILAGMSPLAEGLEYYYQHYRPEGDWQKDFPYIHCPETLEQKILTLVDHMVTPKGEIVPLQARLTDIRRRYSESDPVRDIVDMAWPHVLQAQEVVLHKLNLSEDQLINRLEKND